MKEVQYSIGINASKEKVWNTLWEDASLRIWAEVIDEGTYMEGELIEGNEIQFISSVNGYGVTSLVEKLEPNVFVLLRHDADTQDSGIGVREKEWTGGKESYTLSESNGVTTLSVKFDVPEDLEEIFNDRFPKALEIIRKLSENN